MDYIILYCICQEFFWFFLQFRIHCEPHIPPLLACLHHHSFVSFQIECDFNTGSGGHLLSDPGGARCQNRTALLVPKTSVLPLHFILHINGAPCRNRTHFRCLQNNCSSHWANGAYILYEPYVHSAFIELVVPISESSGVCKGAWTLDLSLKRRLLYQLSYTDILPRGWWE